MSVPYDFTDELIHVLIVIMSLIVVGISLLAYLRRRTSRYLFLFLAFAFITLSQTVTAIETFYLSNQLILIPYSGLHITHLFDFATLLSFGLALLRS
jgi:hypothetical protein